MKTQNRLATLLSVALVLPASIMMMAMSGGEKENNHALARSESACDIYARGGTPCVAAHSTTRALYASYNGPLYQVRRKSDGKTQDIGLLPSGYANAAAQDAFCANNFCVITKVYDQSGKGNDLLEAPPGTYKGTAKGMYDYLPIADMAPVSINGHKAYGVFIMPGMGLRNNNARDLAINDEAEGIYYVVDGKHYDSGCCFDYGNASTNSRAVGTGTMETTYFGTSTAWGSGNGSGPWIMSDMEAGLFSGFNAKKNDVPSIDSWKFVSAFMDGGSNNQWDLRGGDAQKGNLTTFYSGVRPGTPASKNYSPMSKKGGILLGNGGDNGNGSSGTFYEGVMTTGYPSTATTDAVQANIVAARYNVQPVGLSRLTSFKPGASQDVTVTFTNTTTSALKGVKLSVQVPKGWKVASAAKSFTSVAEGASVNASFKITAPLNSNTGYVTGTANWTGATQPEIISQRVRSVLPVKINEVRFFADGSATNQFVELYNASANKVDISNWKVISTQGGVTTVKLGTIPAGTKISGHGFYVFGLAASGLIAPANVGDAAINVHSVAGLSAGQTINIDGEIHKISSVGTAAAPVTSLYIPVSTSARLVIPAGSTNIPVTSTAGFVVGQKIGIDIGGNYEVATVTSVGKAGTQSNLFAEAKAGSTTIKVTDNSNMTVGETLTINTGARKEVVTIKSIKNVVTAPLRGTGEAGEVELTAPLKLDHMTQVDVYAQGTGISFSPATRFAHHSGDAVQALGTGIVLDGKITKHHDTGAPIIDAKNTAAGYQGAKPNQWFGLPMSVTAGALALMDGNAVADAIIYGPQQSNSSANGAVTNPELATLEGVQGKGGCIVNLPGSASGARGFTQNGTQVNKSLGRYPDGYDTDSNCDDFTVQSSVTLAGATTAGSNNIKVSGVTGFKAGQKIIIGTGNTSETVKIGSVGTAGGTIINTATEAGATTIPVANVAGFEVGQTLIIGTGTNRELAVITAVTPGRRGFGGNGAGSSVTVKAPLVTAHGTDTPVTGSGITLAAPLTKAHDSGAQIISGLPTPGAANQYTRAAAK